jgi:hypothetical protein
MQSDLGFQVEVSWVVMPYMVVLEYQSVEGP